MLSGVSGVIDFARTGVIAIDPGTTESAVAIWHDGAGVSASKLPNEEVFEAMCQLTCGTILIEQITSYGMPVGREVFQTVWWTGRFYQFAMKFVPLGVDVLMIPRKDVKLWHCGTPAAKDSNVIAALKEKYGEKGTKKAPGLTYPLSGDTWQAFALATYWTEKYGRRDISN